MSQTAWPDKRYVGKIYADFADAATWLKPPQSDFQSGITGELRGQFNVLQFPPLRPRFGSNLVAFIALHRCIACQPYGMRACDAPGMRYAVVDVETTGFSPISDQVVEIACVLVEDLRICEMWSTLVDPGRPIPAHATRVHGIGDDDVAGAPSFEFAQRRLKRRCKDATVVAHNASFDLGFLPALARMPSLCTVQLARRWFPDAPNHKNQTLRAYLGIDRDPRFADLPAHRALGDAMVTAAILIRCLEKYHRTPCVRIHA